jgi:hypothetical protein
MVLGILVFVLAVLLYFMYRCEKCGSLKVTHRESSHFDEHTQGYFTHFTADCRACGHRQVDEKWQARSASDRRHYY